MRQLGLERLVQPSGPVRLEVVRHQGDLAGASSLPVGAIGEEQDAGSGQPARGVSDLPEARLGLLAFDVGRVDLHGLSHEPASRVRVNSH